MAGSPTKLLVMPDPTPPQKSVAELESYLAHVRRRIASGRLGAWMLGVYALEEQRTVARITELRDNVSLAR